jgi:hypothetical protein
MKQRFGKVLLVLSLLATLGLVATGIQGYGIESLGDRPALELHLTLAMVSILIIFFAHTWIVIYLFSLHRQLRSWATPRGQGPAVAELRAAPAVRWGSFALLAVLVAFGLGPAAMMVAVPIWLHPLASLLALGIQGVALWLERRALGQTEKVLAFCRTLESA